MIEWTQHVIVGANPRNPEGFWLTKAAAETNFAFQLETLLKDAEGKVLLVHKAPALKGYKRFDTPNPVYSMIARFSIGKLKGET
jgi:hypothetical protein